MVYGSGLSTGLAFWGLIAASGMGVVLQNSVFLLSVLKILGGLYLLWLAVLSARSAWRPDSEDRITSAQSNWFVQGLLLNLSNPKAVLAWMAALSVGLNPDADIIAVAIATAACMVAGFLVYLLYSILFSMGGVMNTYKRCRRWIEGAVAGFFTLAGIGLVRSSFTQQS